MTDTVIPEDRGLRPDAPVGPILAVAALGWAAVAVWLAANGAFVPPRGWPPLGIAAAFLGLPAAYLAALRTWPALGQWVDGCDPAALAAPQAMRVVGAVFLFLWGLGLLPGLFALVAGVGDVIVGAYAVRVLPGIARRATGWALDSRRLAVMGLADFAAAFTTAVLTGEGFPMAQADGLTPALMQVLPMAVIPVVLVPGFIVLHLMVLRRARLP